MKGRALRDMANPGTAYDDPRLGRDPQPGHMDDFVVTSRDNGGVHINSGIPNRAFVLVARALGGHAWEDAGAIWYAAITGDIKADCDFAEFARLTEAVAVAEFGTDSTQARAVADAWRTVGVTPAAAPVKKKRKTKAARGGASGAGKAGPPASPTSDTTVSVTRSGGIAGMVVERTVALGELPDSDTQAWQGLLAEPAELRAMAKAPAAHHPDAFCYGIACTAPKVDVSISEPALPDDVRSLLDRTLEGADWVRRTGEQAAERTRG